MPFAAQPNNLAWPPPEWADWSPSDPKAVDELLKKEFPEEERAKVWEKAATAVKTHHDELVEQWQKAMDSVLVYAGLFSAVLTAFNILAYPLLQRDPTDPMLAAIQQISAQLNSFSVNPSFINSTQPVRSTDQPQPPFRASASAVWINTLWFASLVCSLASASIALMVKQWLFEESKGLSGISRETARLRQYRLHSLMKWRVGTIVLLPSVLLQFALFLFLGGLIILLWKINETVAAVITALIGALFVLVIFFTTLPIFISDCCYRSPQALGAFMVAKVLWNEPIRLARTSLHSLYNMIPHSPNIIIPIRIFKHLCNVSHHLIGKIPLISTWNGSERTEITRNSGLLDRRIATMAYTTTFATEHLETLHILLSDLPCDQLFPCFSDIHYSWIQLWGTNDPVRRSGKLTEILCGKPFYCALRKVLAIDPSKRASALGGNWTGLSSEYLLSSYNAHTYIPLSVNFLSTLVHLSVGKSAIAEKISSLLYHRFNFKPTSAVTYDALRGVTAVAMHNVTTADWPADTQPQGPQQVVNMLSVVRLSLEFTRLINNVGLSREQYMSICNQSRQLLSCLKGKMTTVTNIEIWLAFGSILSELTNICLEVSKGYEMVPKEFLVFQWPSERVSGDIVRSYITSCLDHLEFVIHQRLMQQHGKRCFQAQQPPAMVF